MSAADKTRRELYFLGGLVVLLAILVYAQFGRGDAAKPGTPAGTGAQPSNQAAGTGNRSNVPVTDVRLDALKHDEDDLAEPERNPFRFQPKAPPPQSSGPAVRPSQTVAPPPAATGPPPPPPIPLKYVGLYGTPTQPDRVAILADARGNPFYGREGDIIEGRYRVLRITADSVDVAYADGRGRQTIRLSSQ
jgi:hypothetical protein